MNSFTKVFVGDLQDRQRPPAKASTLSRLRGSQLHLDASHSQDGSAKSEDGEDIRSLEERVSLHQAPQPSTAFGELLCKIGSGVLSKFPCFCRCAAFSPLTLLLYRL